MARGYAVALCLAIATLASEVVWAQPAPLAGWRDRLERIESDIKALRADDTASLGVLARQIAELRGDITSWLASHRDAAEDIQPWLDAVSGDVRRIEDVAVQIGHLRTLLSRVAALLAQRNEAGAFYLGRVDVAVTAEAVRAAGEMVPAGAVVLEARDLRALNRVSLSEALSLVPGASSVRIGQRNETTIKIRGFDIRQVPVFVDGIPIYAPYDGSADLDRFTTFDVAELRVSKGFSSVLSGPNTLGGVINIVSRRPTKRFEGSGGIGLGSGPARSAFVNAGSRVGFWYGQGGLSYRQTESFPLAGGFQANALQQGRNRDNAYRRDWKFNVKLGWSRDGLGEYAVSYVGLRGRKGQPPYSGSDPSVRVRYWRWPYWNKDSLYFISHTALGRGGYLRGRLYFDRYDNAVDSYDDASYTTQLKSSSFRSVYDDDTFGGSIEWGKTFGSRQTLRAVVHAKRERHKAWDVGAPAKRAQGAVVSAAVEDTYALSSRLSLVAGVSADRQTTSRAEAVEKLEVVSLPLSLTGGVNPQAGLFVSLPRAGLIRATVSRKTRLPSLKDRYSYRQGISIPNPYLKPERATTVEAGYVGPLGTRSTMRVTVFSSRIADLIERSVVGPNVSQQQNIGRVTAAGVEADFHSKPVDRVDVTLTYAYLRRRSLSDPGTPLLDAPRHKGMAWMMVVPFRPLSLAGYVEVESGRQTLNDAGHLYQVPSFVTLGARVAWAFTSKLEAEATATNLTDRNYWLAEGYPEPGRVIAVNLNFRF